MDFGTDWTLDDLVDELGWGEVDRLVEAATKIQLAWRVKKSMQNIRAKVHTTAPPS